MGTTVDPQEADPRTEETTIPLVPQDERDSRDALAKLAEEAARATAKLRPAAVANFSAGPRVGTPVIDPVQALRTPAQAPRTGDKLAAAAALRAGDKFSSAPRPESRRSVSGPLRFVLAVTVGVAVTLAWQSYGEAAKQVIAVYVPALGIVPTLAPSSASTGAGHEADRIVVAATDPAPGSMPATAPPATAPPVSPAAAPAAVAPPAAPVAAPPPELVQQIESIAHELAALRETVTKVSAAQDQMGRAVAKLQDDEETSRKPAPLPRPAPTRRHTAAAARPLPPPVASAAPHPSAPTVTSTSLPPLTAPQPSPVPELNRRPPASMP